MLLQQWLQVSEVKYHFDYNNIHRPLRRNQKILWNQIMLLGIYIHTYVLALVPSRNYLLIVISSSK